MIFGFLTQMVGVAVLGPALIGVGAAFGGKALLDDHKRQVATRRQQARTFYRDFEESTQFEVGVQIRDTTRELQREIRDRVMNRLQELTRTYTETLQSLQHGGAQDEETRQQRAAVLATRIGKLDEVLHRITALDAA